MNKESEPRFKPGERSFTLLETVIALGLMVSIILEVSSVQGSAINFSMFSRKATQAAWIAKGVMAEIEYKSKFYPLKEMKSDPTYKDRKVSDAFCPKEKVTECDFTYTVTIEDFDLPIIDILLGKKGGSKSDEDDAGEDEEGGDPMSELIKEKVKEILGDEILKIARVEVFWPEGATRSSVALSYLIANQKALDEYIETLPPLKAPPPKNAEAKCPAGQIFNSKENKCIPDPNAKEKGSETGGEKEGDIPDPDKNQDLDKDSES